MGDRGRHGPAGRQNSGSAEQTAKQRLLVVGNGMVGHHFVEQLVAAGGLSGSGDGVRRRA